MNMRIEVHLKTFILCQWSGHRVSEVIIQTLVIKIAFVVGVRFFYFFFNNNFLKSNCPSIYVLANTAKIFDTTDFVSSELSREK